MLLISRTYQTITPESAEDGDFADSGYVYESEPMSFRDIVRELQGMGGSYLEPSYSPIRAEEALRLAPWVSEPDYGTTDYGTGETRSESLHLAEDTPRGRRYWLKALRAAGVRIREV